MKLKKPLQHIIQLTCIALKLLQYCDAYNCTMPVTSLKLDFVDFNLIQVQNLMFILFHICNIIITYLHHYL